MRIEIKDNDTLNTGTYEIWFKDCGVLRKKILSELDTDSLLNLRQKENFFMGYTKFIINNSDAQILLS